MYLFIYLKGINYSVNFTEFIHETSFLYNFHFRIFTEEEVEQIRKITLWDILVNASDIEPDAIQRNVFVWTEGILLKPYIFVFQFNVRYLGIFYLVKRNMYDNLSLKKNKTFMLITI